MHVMPITYLMQMVHILMLVAPLLECRLQSSCARQDQSQMLVQHPGFNLRGGEANADQCTRFNVLDICFKQRCHMGPSVADLLLQQVPRQLHPSPGWGLQLVPAELQLLAQLHWTACFVRGARLEAREVEWEGQRTATGPPFQQAHAYAADRALRTLRRRDQTSF